VGERSYRPGSEGAAGGERVTKIEWADKVWNPVTGCTPISEGCQNCYAERMSKRLAGRCGYSKEDPFQVKLHPDRLEEPFRWKKPSRIFVCSMGDLFHDDVPRDYLRMVWSVMLEAERHTFMILTKRAYPMSYLVGGCEEMSAASNIWLGVSVENQRTADLRIPFLLKTKAAAVRFVSVEPMLGPVDIEKYLPPTGSAPIYPWHKLESDKGGPWLDWVICGGETGPGARPMHPDWVRSLREQCQEAGVPFFFKSWGEWVAPSQMPSSTYREIEDFGKGIGISDNPRGVGKKRSGRLLDGQEWNEMPEVKPWSQARE